MLEEIQAGVHNFHCYFNFVNLCIKFPKTDSRYRGCYMATWRYKISLRVLKNIS